MVLLVKINIITEENDIIIEYKPQRNEVMVGHPEPEKLMS